MTIFITLPAYALRAQIEEAVAQERKRCVDILKELEETQRAALGWTWINWPEKNRYAIEAIADAYVLARKEIEAEPATHGVTGS